MFIMVNLLTEYTRVLADTWFMKFIFFSQVISSLNYYRVKLLSLLRVSGIFSPKIAYSEFDLYPIKPVNKYRKYFFMD